MTRNVLVLITTSFPIESDGREAAGSFVVDLADELAGILPIRVVAPGKANGIERRRSGVEVFRYEAPSEPLSTLSISSPASAFKVLRVLHSGLVATRKAADKGGVTHLLALWALPSGYWAKRVGRRLNVPYSVWTLGSDIWSLGKIPLVRSYLRRVLQTAEFCFSDGYKLKEDTQKLAGRAVAMLPSTRKLDVPRTKPKSTKPPYRLFYLGRWHPNKGVDILLDALRLLSDDDWLNIADVHIAGGGPLDSVVRKGVSALVKQGRPVRLSGYLDRERAAAAFSQADILCLPSRIESIPVVFSDALRAGLRVIACPVGDMPRLLAGGGGTVADKISADSLAEAIARGVRLDTGQQELQRLNELAAMFDITRVAQYIAALAKTSSNDKDVA